VAGSHSIAVHVDSTQGDTNDLWMSLGVVRPPAGLTVSIVTTAGYYSALAGVLAGFAFAAIILVIPGGF
jgi:hypothetical protein